MTNYRFKNAYMRLSRENKYHIYVRNKIAFECNIDTQTVYRWMNGYTDVPHLAKPIIASILKMPIEELFPEPVDC